MGLSNRENYCLKSKEIFLNLWVYSIHTAKESHIAKYKEISEPLYPYLSINKYKGSKNDVEKIKLLWKKDQRNQFWKDKVQAQALCPFIQP